MDRDRIELLILCFESYYGKGEPLPCVQLSSKRLAVHDSVEKLTIVDELSLTLNTTRPTSINSNPNSSWRVSRGDRGLEESS